MAKTLTLKAIFAENKEKLTDSLKGLSLPRDARKVQKIVSDFLSDMFENNGDYRQSLTESEDYILQASLRLLQAQQSITSEIVRASQQIEPQSSEASKNYVSHSSPYYAIAGAGIGAIAGGLAGTWGAVAGAIAGTAIVIYCSAKRQSHSTDHDHQKVQPQVNTEVLASIVENVCSSIDGVIETYRVQAKRIKDVYEQREKPTLQSDYSSLLEQIQNIYNAIKSASDSVPTTVSNAADSLAESLENYGLKVENGKIINE